MKNNKVRPHDTWIYFKFTRNFAMTKIDEDGNEILFDVGGEFSDSEVNEAMMNVLACKYEREHDHSDFFITELQNGTRVLLIPHCDEEEFSYELGDVYGDRDFDY